MFGLTFGVHFLIKYSYTHSINTNLHKYQDRSVYKQYIKGIEILGVSGILYYDLAWVIFSKSNGKVVKMKDSGNYLLGFMLELRWSVRCINVTNSYSWHEAVSQSVNIPQGCRSHLDLYGPFHIHWISKRNHVKECEKTWKPCWST